MAHSRVYLPKLNCPPATILDFLVKKFPHIPAEKWRDRIDRGIVTAASGTPITPDTPYRHGQMIFYVKEVPFEPPCDEEETILYQDEQILVANKPHGMPVTPAGQHIARSLLNRLQQRTGIESLVPLHRLDRDTAGVVLFGLKAECRARYHQLFATGKIRREYFAVALVAQVPEERQWLVQNRMEPGDPWFRQKVVATGHFNAKTEITLIETRGGLGIFHLVPYTGRKHQLRVHMHSIGHPILGDLLYPQINEPQPAVAPLQLLASRLAFMDPVTGLERDFRSPTRLQHAWGP
ncbi:MAG TPA: pseudouridine synthase [Terriglobia bacterium]|nr:pseudouridine synthase [Terriglobia bacterium]